MYLCVREEQFNCLRKMYKGFLMFNIKVLFSCLAAEEFFPVVQIKMISISVNFQNRITKNVTNYLKRVMSISCNICKDLHRKLKTLGFSNFDG